MRSYLFASFLIFCTYTCGQIFAPGTTLESVQSEMGTAESRFEQGSKEILIYADGTRLEFIDGKLVAPSPLPQSAQAGDGTSKTGADDPLINAQAIVEQRQQQTISASARRIENDYSLLSDNDNNRKIFEAELRSEAAAASPLLGNTIRGIVIVSGIEFFVTFLLLALALQLCGFPSALWPALLLGLALALVGALLATLLPVGPLHPLRIVAGFAILFFALSSLAQQRRWGTAITIAALARLAFALFAGLGLYGLDGLLNI